MWTFLEKNISRPPVQAALVYVIALLLMAGNWVLEATELSTPDPLFAWPVAAAFMLLFALFNSLMSLRADSYLKYWGASIYSYGALAFSTGATAWLFTGIDIRDAGTYAWIYLVVTVGFLVFLSLVNFMRIIVNFAEREEWTQPRKRKK